MDHEVQEAQLEALVLQVNLVLKDMLDLLEKEGILDHKARLGPQDL